MSGYKVFIATDSNRKELKITTSDITDRRQDSSALRVVYEELHPNYHAAQRRTGELSHYTRMQIERLIRKQNPNWADLRTITNRVQSSIQMYQTLRPSVGMEWHNMAQGS